jgi:hypothetical protein
MAVTESKSFRVIAPPRFRVLIRALFARPVPAMAALFVVGVRLAFLAYAGLTFEDAYISLRYAENLVDGYGLVYNHGERVFGATTPLYVLLLALFRALGVTDPLLAGKLLGAAADGLTAALWYAMILRRTGSRLAGWVFLLLFGLSPFVVDVSVSGMETSLVLVGLTAAFLAAETGRWMPMGLAIGLTALVRLDTLLFGGILFLYGGLRERRLSWREALVVLVCLAPWLLFATLYYGSPIPNSIPAKLAAYQAHRPSILPNLFYATSFIAPFRNGWREECFNAVVAPLFLLGCARILRQHRDWWPVPAFFAAHWAFLVLSRTVLFRWYFVPALLPFYVVAGIGALALASDSTPRRGRSAVIGLVLLALTAHTAGWLCAAAIRARRLQVVEGRTRRDIGLWLRRNSPPDATVALEPIGYIGYFSRRRVIDEVGLVTPAMIPILRAGDGWFGRAMRRFQPDYVVERIHFLARNDTINAHGLTMFATAEDRRWFERTYAPVRWYCEDVSPFQARSYSFVIFARRADVTPRSPARSPMWR